MSRNLRSKDSPAAAEERDGIDRWLEKALPMFPSLDPETEAAVDRMCWVVKHIDQVADQTVSAYDLNNGEFKVLLKLRKHPEGRMTAGELASHLRISSSAMTNRLDRLEEAGYVTRERDADDRRTVVVELTASGIETLTKAVEAQGFEERDLLSVLTPKEQRTLNELLRKLLLEVERREPTGRGRRPGPRQPAG